MNTATTNKKRKLKKRIILKTKQIVNGNSVQKTTTIVVSNKTNPKSKPKAKSKSKPKPKSKAKPKTKNKPKTTTKKKRFKRREIEKFQQVGGELVDISGVLTKQQLGKLSEEQKRDRRMLKNRASANRARNKTKSQMSGLNEQAETLEHENTQLTNELENITSGNVKIRDRIRALEEEIQLLRYSANRKRDHSELASLNQPIQQLSEPNFESIPDLNLTDPTVEVGEFEDFFIEQDPYKNN
ncbi:x-box binding protein [Anaeramoeba flamelloides]|uniref:X-box-binding protein 1 n=1 Tax=Anaeramoeba flamelloides TaxID=1746091 RepID=A0AAV7YQM8_9EUKA|nr:x-box binding protein [Anaeramoeba flamelloides]